MLPTVQAASVFGWVEIVSKFQFRRRAPLKPYFAHFSPRKVYPSRGRSPWRQGPHQDRQLRHDHGHPARRVRARPRQDARQRRQPR
jgi:hypothetical protein